VPSTAVQVHRYRYGSFLLLFQSRQVTDRVLHAQQSPNAELTLVFRWWQCQSSAHFQPLCFKVLMTIDNIPAHAWSLNMTQAIVHSSCLIFDSALNSSLASDMSEFLVVAWSMHPDLIPSEVICSILEPEEESQVGRPPLFLRESEIIHSKQDALHYWAIIHILEIHDFNPQEDSDDSSSGSSDSRADGIPENGGDSSLRSWPRIFWAASEGSSSDGPWPELPR
jgi:hypothetical protein